MRVPSHSDQNSRGCCSQDNKKLIGEFLMFRASHGVQANASQMLVAQNKSHGIYWCPDMMAKDNSFHTCYSAFPTVPGIHAWLPRALWLGSQRPPLWESFKQSPKEAESEVVLGVFSPITLLSFSVLPIGLWFSKIGNSQLLDITNRGCSMWLWPSPMAVIPSMCITIVCFKGSELRSGSWKICFDTYLKSTQRIQ